MPEAERPELTEQQRAAVDSLTDLALRSYSETIELISTAAAQQIHLTYGRVLRGRIIDYETVIDESTREENRKAFKDIINSVAEKSFKKGLEKGAEAMK